MPSGSVPSRKYMFEKSTFPPTSAETNGMIKSPTIESTILPKAAPMITPTARSNAFPLTANSRNSDNRLIFGFPVLCLEKRRAGSLPARCGTYHATRARRLLRGPRNVSDRCGIAAGRASRHDVETIVPPQAPAREGRHASPRSDPPFARRCGPRCTDPVHLPVLSPLRRNKLESRVVVRGRPSSPSPTPHRGFNG